jgi:peptide chain release factor 2
LSAKKVRVEELDVLMARPDFWGDKEKVSQLGRERTRFKEEIESWGRLNAKVEEAGIAFELLEEEEDPGLRRETLEQLEAVERGIRDMEFHKMLSGPNDLSDAIVSINAGAGGTEAQDWAEMLLRMYLRWAEKRGYTTELMDRLPGDEAGIKSATFTVQGRYAYGYLSAEIGVHRLVRISPFDAQARRHTSFASVSVYPDVEDESAVEIDEKDLKIDVFRASGAGGQHVNKTESAVRITHLPTGIVVGCQSERSQHKNRSNAMRILRAKIQERERLAKEKERAAQDAEKMEIAWGSQIRSYILQPYQKAKDHRTEAEEGNVQAVLDGDLDGLIESYLLQKSEKKSA